MYATPTCKDREELCSLDETAVYCNVAKNSTLSVDLMWGVFGLHFVQAGCAFVLERRLVNLHGFSFIGGTVIVFLLIIMQALQIWAIVGEEKAMQPVYDSNLLSKPHADGGRICAYISCCFIFLQIISASMVCILFLMKRNRKAKKMRAKHKEDTPLIATAGGETTPDSGYSSSSSGTNPVYKPAIDDTYQTSSESDGLPSYHA